jgi:hypothetical protein
MGGENANLALLRAFKWTLPIMDWKADLNWFALENSAI